MSGGDGQEDPPCCDHCGEVIGVYEPMIVVSGGVPARTSRAALQREVRIVGGPCFHAHCFAQRDPA